MPKPKDKATTVSTDKPISEHAGDKSRRGERTGMQNDSAVTEMELGFQEMNDIALNGKEIHEETSH